MVTRFYNAAILLAAVTAAADIASQSTVLLDASSVSISKPETTVTPLTRINTAPSVTTLAIAQASSAHGIIISSTDAAPALPTVVSTKSKKGGFQGKLKRKTTAVLQGNETTEGSLQRRDGFSAEIVNHWLVVFDVGTPPQPLELSLDLGSDGFVVESTLVPEDLRTTSHPIYYPDNSTTGQLIDGYTWEVYYGGFALNGIVYTDTITLGDNSWHNMTMEVVTGMPYGSAIETASGILGLAAHLTTGANPSYVPSFLGAIEDQLEDVVFTISMDPVSLEGTIDFGYIEESKYTGDIAYAPLYNAEDTTFWSLNVSGIGAADPKTGELIYSNMTQFTAILDTGAETSQLPLAALWGWYGGIEGSIFDEGGYCWDYVCSVNTSLPDLVLFIDDKPIVVPRPSYGYWQTMNPANGVEDVEYCTAHMRPSDYFNGGVNFIGQDIIEGIFLVLDWQNQQIGFGNSTTAMSTDSGFIVPGPDSPPPSTTPPSDNTCSYATANETIDPFITGCTEKNLDGTCYHIEVNYLGCTALDTSLDLVSVQPVEDSNIRCTFYSDNSCANPLSGATNVTHAGGASSLSQIAESVFCASVGVEPEGEEGALMVYCGEGYEDTSGCWLTGQDPWSCAINYAPPEEFKFNVTSVYSWHSGNVGTCYFYEDTSCTTLVTPDSGIDMCRADLFGETLPIALESYLGSILCF